MKTEQSCIEKLSEEEIKNPDVVFYKFFNEEIGQLKDVKENLRT